MGDSNSTVAWHRVQLKKNRDSIKVLEKGRLRVGNNAELSGQIQKDLAALRRKILESERCIAVHERRSKRPVATDFQSLARVTWSSWNARSVSHH